MKAAGVFILATLLYSFKESEPLCKQYTYVREDLREGRPSKCDCDYHKQVLSLEKDGNFHWYEYEGYVTEKLEAHYAGTWQVKKDSILELNVSVIKKPDSTDSIYTRKTDFIIKYHRLHKRFAPPDDPAWEGSGC